MKNTQNPDPLIIIAVILLSIIQLTIKGVALWRASQGKQRNWFIALFALMPLNDLGILELIFLFRFAKKRLTIEEVKGWIKLLKR